MGEIKTAKDDELRQKEAYKSDLKFILNGMTEDEYLSKIEKELNSIDLDSAPIDRWDLFVAFSLGVLESASDLFISDPDFKHSLNDSQGPLVGWLNKTFHQSDLLGHSGQPIDYQGDGYGGPNHRVMSLLHGTPMAYFAYRKKPEKNKELSSAAKAWNAALIARDVILCVFAIYCISAGVFIDIKYENGKWVVVCEDKNQKGTPYEKVNAFIAIIKYLIHVFADFFSTKGLVIPGFEYLTRFTDSEIAKFATKLYRKGMNMRTLSLQAGIQYAIDWLMRTYIEMRAMNKGYSDAAVEHKTAKMLLIAHGICCAVNVGKVCITKAPWRLNLVVITRTCKLVWSVVEGEVKLTNSHIEKLDWGILKARVETCKTLVLLDETAYETANVGRTLRTLAKRMKESSENIDASIAEVDSEFKSMLEKIGG